ncbi:MAG TPA: hypothetical protein VN708_17615 [Terriglobales bacterium]|jgi:hypothetical protein|nr:hypothetical protein [Terriglobales bacterium]
MSLLLVLGRSRVWGQAALLLEEPYSYDGTFAGTGHTAVYLARVCAETPFQLRRCGPGEQGVVISRYHGIAGHDWIAIPLIPYLYAVRNPDDIPLFVDSKLVAFLREQFLTSLPLPEETRPGAEPRYQLAGSAYDRTLYGFRIATRPDQDDALIRTLNASPNEESYKLLRRNCADFSKQIINFYYPHAVHRSVIADLGITTPKQAAKSLVHYSKHHRETQLTTFVIPQVPGLKRSKSVHGILESVFFQKKYVTPVLLFHPFVVGAVETAYLAGWRFNPGKGAMVFNAGADNPMKNFDPPLTASQRRSYENLVKAMKKSNELDEFPNWRSLQARATPQIDAQGRPFVQVKLDGKDVPVGICRGNALHVSGSPELLQNLLLSRLDEQLRNKKPRISEPSIKSDWRMLESAREESRAALAPGN